MNLLTSCSPKNIYVHDYCSIYTLIQASDKDKLILKESDISKEFILQIVNNNDIWNEMCLVENKI